MVHPTALLLLGFASAIDAKGTTATTTTLPPYPAIRFTPWDKLPHDLQKHATSAGYTEKSWNKPNKFKAEQLDYSSLKPETQQFLNSIDMPPASWDCYINHYRNYAWKELERSHQAKSYDTLGWSPEMWENDEAPEEDGKYWEDLSGEQQQAAASVCYTKELWDEVAIPLWEEDDGSGGEVGEKDAEDLYSNQEEEVVEEKQDIYEQMYDENDKSDVAFEGPASAYNDRGIEVPYFRYDPWDILDPTLKAYAQKVYDEKSWNALGRNKLELMDFHEIKRKDPKSHKALLSMGFTEEQWDCYITHYSTYTWGELDDAGVKQFFKKLGYSHKTWEQKVTPESIGMYWPDLTIEQQEAAYQVGYFREVWDDVSLQFWPRTTANTATLKDYVKNHQAAVGGGSLGVLLGLILACACCYRAISKKKKTAGFDSAPRDLEMSTRSRFSDYSDEPTFDDDGEDANPIV